MGHDKDYTRAERLFRELEARTKVLGNKLEGMGAEDAGKADLEKRLQAIGELEGEARNLIGECEKAGDNVEELTVEKARETVERLESAVNYAVTKYTSLQPTS